MGAVVMRLGAPGTVAQQMREFQTNSARGLGSYVYSFKEWQVLSGNIRMYTRNKNTLHVWCIDYCSLSTSKSYYSTQHLIKHSIVCIATLRITKNQGKWFRNESRWNRNNNPTQRLMISNKHGLNVIHYISHPIMADICRNTQFIKGAKMLEALVVFPNDLSLASVWN